MSIAEILARMARGLLLAMELLARLFQSQPQYVQPRMF